MIALGHALVMGAAAAAATVPQMRQCRTTPTAGVDRCPGGPPGYRAAAVPAASAAADCAALCCAQPECAVWVTRPTGPVAVPNCSAGSSCCWTKPDCTGELPSPGATSGTVVRPIPGNWSFVDTEGWVGSEYTPARAANQLWWARYPEVTLSNSSLPQTCDTHHCHCHSWSHEKSRLTGRGFSTRPRSRWSSQRRRRPTSSRCCGSSCTRWPSTPRCRHAHRVAC